MAENLPSTIEAEEPGYDDNQIFRWVDAMPEPRYGRAMQKEQIQALHNAALAMPYKGLWNPDTQRHEVEPDYIGMTQGEVMIARRVQRAAEGDERAITEILDRVLGKPKQAMEVQGANVGYVAFLELSAQEERDKHTQTIDITPTRRTESLEELINGV